MKGLSPPPTVQTNIIGTLQRALFATGASSQIRVALPARPSKYDLRLEARGAWWSDDRFQRKVMGLREVGLIEQVKIRGSEAWVRIADETLAGAPWPPIPESSSDLSPLLVQFCDPNTTKALHLGHLRNIAIGNALAAMHEVTGRLVLRQSVVCDFGRGMAEAMAGWLACGSSQLAGKSDHLVGEKYSRFVSARTENGAAVGPADKPVAREVNEEHDLAQSLLVAWLAEHPVARKLWSHVRALVLKGHEETMARLGVRLDRQVYESEWHHLSESIIKRGLEIGIFKVNQNNDVVFNTSLEEQEQVVLLRDGEIPTVHLRTLAVWVGIDDILKDWTVVLVGGDEWRVHDICIEAMLSRYLGPTRRCASPTHVTYGMVRQDGTPMKSSFGAVLIDDVLQAMLETTGRWFANTSTERPQGLAASALVGFFLGFPQKKAIDLKVEQIFDPQKNLSLRVLESWLQAQDRSTEEAPSVRHALHSSPCRWVILQAHWIETYIAHARSQLEPRVVMGVYAYLANWYLQAEHDPEVAGFIADVLSCGLETLGLHPEGSIAGERWRRYYEGHLRHEGAPLA